MAAADANAKVDAIVDIGAPPRTSVRIQVVFSPRAGEVDESTLSLPIGSTVADALRASGLTDRHRALDLSTLATGIWGRSAERSERLRDQDRVELYRALLVDPKEARRRRHALQRAALRANRPNKPRG